MMNDINDIFKKFPPERKDEFLNWVMITQLKSNWVDVVCKYAWYHQLKNWYEGFQFMVTWSIAPCLVAYQRVNNGYAEPEWAMKIIESAKTGDPSQAAYYMLKDRCVSEEWTMKIIENDKISNSPLFAYLMVKNGHAKPEWAMRIIENATTGDPPKYANLMVVDGFASQEWYDKVKFLAKK